MALLGICQAYCQCRFSFRGVYVNSSIMFCFVLSQGLAAVGFLSTLHGHHLSLLNLLEIRIRQCALG